MQLARPFPVARALSRASSCRALSSSAASIAGEDAAEGESRLSTLAEKRDFALSQFSSLSGAVPNLVSRLPEAGVLRPNPVQRLAFAPIFEGKDVVLEAPTGYGKTLAFAFPLFAKLEIRRHRPQVLVLCPTRELAVQTYNKLNKFADFGRPNKKGNAIRVGKLVGSGTGRGHSRGINATLMQGPQVLVATPRAVNKLAREGTIDLFSFTTVVLDEADALLASEEHCRVLGRILKPPRRRQELQFVFVSATPSEDVVRGDLPWRGRASPPEHIRVEAYREKAREAVKHSVLVVGSEAARYEAVASLFARRRRLPGGSLRPSGCAAVFFNRSHSIGPVQRTLQERGVRVGTLYGADAAGRESKKERARTLRAVERGGLQACLATDLLARGMDLDGLRTVVLADAPASWSAYLHRAGRVGRFRDDGATFSLSEGHVISVVTEAEREQLAAWAADAGVPLEPLDASVRL